MCKSINSNVIIGNFMIEAINEKRDYISYNQLIKFDETVTKEIKSSNYTTRFMINEIFDFENNYPFFVKSIDDEKIFLFSDQENVIDRLKRYFRIGLPKDLVKTMSNVSKEILG